MKMGYILFIILVIQGCASKSTETTDTRKEKSVITVFNNQESTTIKKTETTAQTTQTTVPTVPATTEATTTAPVNPNSPKEIIKNYTAELQSLRDEPNVKKKKQDRQIAEKVRKFFDFRSLAQMSLSSYWNQISTKKQEEFVDLFTQLIEKSYLQRSKNLVGSYELSFGNETVNGNKATVTSNIYKDDADFEITYELHKNTDRWMIYNIVFDQVNLVKNYQSQFNKIIAKSNVDELMRIMRKKLNENTSEIDSAL